MSDKTPNPSEPDVDIDDDGEPAFEWMKPAAAKEAPGKAPSASPATSSEAAKPGDAGNPGATAKPGETGNPGAAAKSTGLARTAGASAPVQAGRTPEGQPETRADRKAAEAAGAAPEPALFAEPLPTSALHVRPPEAEVERRNAERELAANAKPVAPRIFQVLLAVFYPVVLLVVAIRAVTSPLFLWVEYNRPGFPGDGYGFSTDDRMTYGSYAVDYLSNWAGPRYLGDLVREDGTKLFKDSEVVHMADVKLVMLSAFGAAALMVLIGIIAMLYLRKRSTGGIRRGLFAGSIATLVVILALGTLGVLGWQQFFTEFHRIFFANGTWTFALEDTLIRLFPGQFWMDAGIAIAGLVFLAALLTLIFTWPTRRRRGLPPRKGPESGTDAAEEAGDAGTKESDDAARGANA
ncbi:TIGR01906 family membrane protein [Arthrobacter silvisoli]|uniref:TIGR01906 family membrane protein n=1 Tax=Arthrobacter silvisoli TaxID=2291022 RepID=UPI000E212B32|nr:TIGR01906 family membrane protein [Arthrobacter silvisoli]